MGGCKVVNIINLLWEYLFLGDFIRNVRVEVEDCSLYISYIGFREGFFRDIRLWKILFRI